MSLLYYDPKIILAHIAWFRYSINYIHEDMTQMGQQAHTYLVFRRIPTDDGYNLVYNNMLANYHQAYSYVLCNLTEDQRDIISQEQSKHVIDRSAMVCLYGWVIKMVYVDLTNYVQKLSDIQVQQDTNELNDVDCGVRRSEDCLEYKLKIDGLTTKGMSQEATDTIEGIISKIGQQQSPTLCKLQNPKIRL